MKYEKPQVTVIGSACDLIQECGKQSCTNDGANHSDDPAYDLDE